MTEDRCSKQVNILQGRGCDGRSREAPAFLEEEQEGSGRAKEEEGKESPRREALCDTARGAGFAQGWGGGRHVIVQCDGRERGAGTAMRSRGQPGLDPGGWAVRVSGLHLGARMWMTAIAFAFESGASRGWGEGVERAGRWGLSRSEEG